MAAVVRSSRRIPELDGLRGLAVLLVLVYHYVADQLVSPPGSPVALARKYLELAWSGVDLFFVLSGFLLGGILLDQRGSQRYFRAFYIRRACRILPLYFVLLALFAAAGWLIHATGRGQRFEYLFEPALPIWCYLTFTQNAIMALWHTFGGHWMGVTWSLAIEEQFYLFLPFCLRFVPVRRLPHFLIGVIVAVPLARIALYRYSGHWIPGYVLTPCRADALLLGVVGAWMVRTPAALKLITTRLLRTIFIVMLAGSVLLASRETISTPGTAFLGFSWFAVLYLCMILMCVLDKDSAVCRILRSPSLRFFGLISYGIYLLHDLICGFLHAAILNHMRPVINDAASGGVTLLALAVTVAVAWLSWRLLESQIIAWGHKYGFRPDQAVRDVAVIKSAEPA